MKWLKEVFGEDGAALTYEELEDAIKKRADIQPINLSEGDYIPKGDFTQAKKDWEEIYNRELLAVKKNAAIDMAILQAGGKNPRAIKALLDTEKIVMDAGGSLDGLDLEGLKETDAYLFHTTETATQGTGIAHGQRTAISREEFLQMSYQEKNELYQTNKTLYDTLTN